MQPAHDYPKPVQTSRGIDSESGDVKRLGRRGVAQAMIKDECHLIAQGIQLYDRAGIHVSVGIRK